MIDTVPRPDANLPELLAARARHASDTRLTLDAALGTIVAVGAVFWRGPGWYFIASLAGCFLAFGFWGIADRELGEIGNGESRRSIRLLRIARLVAAVVGAIAAVSTMLMALALALGRMIS
jgi:hypothetical protein